jgi:hypothetical protein
MGMTINRRYRDALYDGLMTDLSAHDDLFTLLRNDEATEAKRLHHRFKGELRLLDDLGRRRGSRDRQHDEDTGQAIVAFVTLQGGLSGDERTVERIRETVATRIGKFARPKRIIWGR